MEVLQSVLLILSFAGLARAGDPSGDCFHLRNWIEGDLVKELEHGGFVAQKGSSKMTRFESGDRFDCEKRCYFYNQNMAYIFGLLPLAPEENLETKMSGAYDLPEWGFKGLNGGEAFGDGLSPSWQLRGDEVVMVVACTPPGESVRYFSATPYLRGTYSHSKGGWIEVAGSMEDGKGVVREADSTFGFENRLKTTAGQPEGLSLKQRDHEFVESAFDKLTVILFGASVSSTENARHAAVNVLRKHGLSDAVNILHIPEDFGEVGLADAYYSKYSYYSLLMRFILDKSGQQSFNDYAAKSPIGIWRLTPKIADWNVISDRFGDSQVIPRKPLEEISDNESYLMDALEALIMRIEQKYSSTHAVAHSQASRSLFASVGINYGKQCLDREIQFCLFETRDAMYPSIFPPVLLDDNTKITYMVGVNHRVAGTAMYTGIAVNSAEKQFTVASLDDIEIYGSAEQFLQGTEFEHLQKFLYAVSFSRSCDGQNYCLVIEKEGALGVPARVPLLPFERVYVKPQTGVGPYAEDILYPHTMTLTPWSDSQERDIVNRPKFEGQGRLACIDSIAGISTCQNAAKTLCCASMAEFDAEGCFCSAEGQVVRSVLGVTVEDLRVWSALCGIDASPC